MLSEGFTLTEALIVLLLVGLMMGFFANSELSAEYRLRHAQDTLTQSILYSRSASLTQDNVALCFDNGFILVKSTETLRKYELKGTDVKFFNVGSSEECLVFEKGLMNTEKIIMKYKTKAREYEI